MNKLIHHQPFLRVKFKKMAKIQFLIACWLSITSGMLSAAEDNEQRSPLGCRNMGYQTELRVLDLTPEKSTEGQSMFFLFNSTEKPIDLYQMRQEDSARSTYLNHSIPPHQWAVLSTSERRLKFICSVTDSTLPYGRVVDCAKSLKVCEYPNVKFGMNNRGNYWIVAGNTRDGAIQEVLRYGVIPAQ